MIDKNLFLYDLAVVAIFKDEARYLKEWLDYHLLAGVEHFYLYNNDSSDDFRKVLAPYVEENLVTLIDLPGRVMQLPAFNDALEKFRFECRYLAFIDLDEFIFPKSNRSVVEVVDEILSHDWKAAGLAINWQFFGSNGNEKADYSRGVLERFTRRAPSHFTKDLPDHKGNRSVKSIINPRRADYLWNPHFAIYFPPFHAVNENAVPVEEFLNEPVTADKIVVNHYFTKSVEEYGDKINRGRSDVIAERSWDIFKAHDFNDEFDDGILKYRAARAKNFSFESNNHRINRVVNSLAQTLKKNFSAESLEGDLETFLTCRAVAEKFQIKIDEQDAEELALFCIYQFFNHPRTLNRFEFQLCVNALPKILTRPFPVRKEILQVIVEKTLPFICEQSKLHFDIKAFVNYKRLRRLLSLIQI
ncbi:MAG: glycosyltransferase family 92 protein [Selenomonadaceae bacterium]|nr:glycosyltransferase family 92 protein [Selenomonadaceae bacterium]MBQ9497824.1 glycosyltransferase family 92 protein [Selenomonadaceae bacterium]